MKSKDGIFSFSSPQNNISLAMPDSLKHESLACSNEIKDCESNFRKQSLFSMLLSQISSNAIDMPFKISAVDQLRKNKLLKGWHCA